ncbi:cadherin-15 isoform X2 [Rhinatrema bivittatum]|uniref:cadherin-15 isoform X2 n=1 Tax=Rhinatrema bivittatum TaxID=194408 RepID=UPI00112699DB|nr:cadherin-15 isoform X2 [Rhinatrema bivittatum]
MGIKVLLTLCLLGPLFSQVLSLFVMDEGPVLYSWPQQDPQADGLKRVKRAWVIPPISVSENYKKIPKALVQIKSDKMKHGNIIYSIKGPGVDEAPRGIFSINKTSGVVSLNAMLDREKNDHFKLKAFAVDLEGLTLEDPTDLEIVVVDQNDNRPLFQRDVFIGHVLEGSIPGTSVMKVEATDADEPGTDNAALRYSILVQGTPQLFSIDGDTGEIRMVEVGLDRETLSLYNLTLQVADMSGDGLTNTATAVIYIDDVNDNPPEFTEDEYSMEVREHSAGVDVGRVSVQDKDLPGSPNWLAKYSLIGSDLQEAFSIRTDPHTNDGVLSVIKPLDYETQDRVQLTISVRNEAELDTAAPKTHRAVAKVTVRVWDVNEPPVFHENPKVVSVREGTSAGSEIAVYTATDPDTRQPQVLSYVAESDPEGWLLVDSVTGRVLAKQDIPGRSAVRRGGWYRAVIVASDDAEPRLSATGTLSIEIVEVNDYAPLLFPLNDFLCSQPGRGSNIILSATDQDLKPQAEPFLFQLHPGNPELSLSWAIGRINDTHAEVKLLTEVEEGVHILRLLVRDSGEPQLEREQFLNVSVCRCDHTESCRPGLAAVFRAGAGISFSALMIILASVILLLLLVLLVAIIERLRRQRFHGGLLASSEDDVRDNVINYDEQGGGEQDQEAYDINQLRNPDALIPPSSPRSKQPIRRDTPYNHATPQYPRKPPSSPCDIEDFISEGLEAADNDPSVPPYDTALIYDHEGQGSLAGTLSSIASSLADSDQDYDYLSEWGPRFRRLADLYSQP